MRPIIPSRWRCGTCHHEHASEASAEQCCVCKKCGATPRRVHGTLYAFLRGMCDPCREAHDASKVVNLPWSLYGELEFAKSTDAEHGTADNFEDVCEHLECPEDCSALHGGFAIEWETLKLDAYDILEGAMTDWFDGALDQVDVGGLQAKLNEWLAEGNAIRCFWVDDSTRVVPDEACKAPVDAIETFARWLS